MVYALTTLCPETGAAYLDTLAPRTQQKCTDATWPATMGQDVSRFQPSTDRLALRWKGWVDAESDIVHCTFRVVSVATGAAVKTDSQVRARGASGAL